MERTRHHIPVSNGIKTYSRIVTRGKKLRPEGMDFPEQRTPFDLTVADDTRIRRPTLQIFVHEIIDDMTAELFAKVHHVMRYPELRCDRSGIVHRTQPAAACLIRPISADVIKIIGLHGDAN